MHIAFGIDDNFAMPCGVMIYSILAMNYRREREREREREINFHIISEKLSENSKQTLRETVEQFSNCKINFYDLTGEIFDNLSKWFSYWARPRLTKATYYRLYIPEVLSENISKCLYFDADMLCVDSIDDLYDTDIKNYGAAGALDVSPRSYAEKLGYDPNMGYFNAGTLLLNLDYWRSNNCAAEIIKFLKDNSDKFLDQDGINYILRGKILSISPKYNMFAQMLERAVFNEKDQYDFYQNALKNPCVIHYASRHKPWFIEYEGAANNLWRFVKSKTIYKDMPLPSVYDISFDSKIKTFFYKLKILRNHNKSYLWFKRLRRKIKDLFRKRKSREIAALFETKCDFEALRRRFE
jgi:lipopolysaccharide biosynthesis glycosyltransferase